MSILYRALARGRTMGYSQDMTARVTVISLGGSLIAPGPGKIPAAGPGASPDSARGADTGGVDTGFLKGFARLAEEHIAADPGRKLIVVCGGGSPARGYQAALREVVPGAAGEELDWVGIAATRLERRAPAPHPRPLVRRGGGD